MTFGLDQITKSKSDGLLLIHPNNPRPHAGLAESLNAAERIIWKLFRFTTEVIEPFAKLAGLPVLAKERAFRHNRDHATAGSKLLEGMAKVVDVRTVCKRWIHHHAIVLAVVFQKVLPLNLVLFGFAAVRWRQACGDERTPTKQWPAR